MQEYPSAIVTWVDSVSHSGWHSEEEIQTFTIHNNMKSVGFLVKDVDDLIVISSNKGHYNYGNSTVIPRVAILSIRIMDEP